MQAETTWTAKDAATRPGLELRQATPSLPEMRRAEPLRSVALPGAVDADSGRRQLGPPEVVRGCR